MKAFEIGGLAFFLLHIFSFPLQAQLNESDTAKFQFRAGLSGALQQGNVELLVLRGRLEIVSNSQKSLVFKSQNNSLYQEFSGFRADNDINSRNYLYWKPFKKFYPFSMIYLQTNFRREVAFRGFGGLGYTWQVVQKAKTNLKLSASLVYESTRFRNDQFNESSYNGDNQISLARATLYLYAWHRLADSKLRFFYSGYWQPGLENIPNNRFQLDVGMNIPLWKGLNAMIQYSFSHEQVVTSSVLPDDRILTFGLSYQLTK
ncbi:hypothetical protein GCM10027164_38190 [Algoriphagus taiwanensis]|uniref:DUF481 domain-containing protein n=1 Tax=Algoriphagus taiwanensis TaxID=1445656 RepID=A0ABQ6PY98_9BACT|nr:hypothetical protein Ataiwa_11730 [Algoriphagus taiwanensis]